MFGSAPARCYCFFFSTDTATTEIYTLSLHDALPICVARPDPRVLRLDGGHCRPSGWRPRSEEHTSELQSRGHLVCRLLLEKKQSKHDAAIQAILALRRLAARLHLPLLPGTP